MNTTKWIKNKGIEFNSKSTFTSKGIKYTYFFKDDVKVAEVQKLDTRHFNKITIEFKDQKWESEKQKFLEIDNTPIKNLLANIERIN